MKPYQQRSRPSGLSTGELLDIIIQCRGTVGKVVTVIPVADQKESKAAQGCICMQGRRALFGHREAAVQGAGGWQAEARQSAVVPEPLVHHLAACKVGAQRVRDQGEQPQGGTSL